MSQNSIHDRLTGVFRSVFNDPSVTISRETTAKDIKGWDSITHLDLITATEEEFKIEISGFEVMNLKNVGDLIDLLAAKTNS
jgi:acyl carrier protein